MNFPEPPPARGDLSKRELEIALLSVEDLSEEEIATRLFLSKLTVHTHRKNIFKKLLVHNVLALAMELMRRGLLKVNQGP